MDDTIEYRCRCGSILSVDSTFVNNLLPPSCPVCLHATWLVRPEDGGDLVGIGASPDVDEMLSLLNAEAGSAQKAGKEILADMKAPDYRWN